MTLSEIELTLTELVSRHPNLDLELLRTLLLAAGWEDKHIQEAVTLFKQKGVEGLRSTHVETPQNLQGEHVQTPAIEQVTSAQASETEITFYQPDGTEEGKLQAFTEVQQAPVSEEKRQIVESVVAQPHVEENVVMVEKAEEQVPSLQSVDEVSKEEIQTSKNDETKTKEVPAEVEVLVEEKEEDIAKANTFEEIATQKVEDKHDKVLQPSVELTEPQSLVIEEQSSVAYIPKKDVQIPEDLPLLPFESSPHVWSFSKYKDTFHSDIEKEIPVGTAPELTKKEQPNLSSVPVQPEVKPHAPPHVPVEVDGEKVPMNKSDESLVFLAGIMLLAIILILGYMYSNGRL